MPIDSIGIYVPGGNASFPSTVLMNAIPAQVAGVKEIIMVSPANSKGEMNKTVLAAAHICDIENIFKVFKLFSLEILKSLKMFQHFQEKV